MHPTAHMTVRETAEYRAQQASKNWPGSVSIHPFKRPAKSTCHKPSAEKKARLIQAIEAHIEQHPHDEVSRRRLKSLQGG